MAHGSNVSCLSLGPSSGRVMVTGGEDRKVNMWAVGKPNVILVRTIAWLLSTLIVILRNIKCCMCYIACCKTKK